MKSQRRAWLLASLGLLTLAAAGFTILGGLEERDQSGSMEPFIDVTDPENVGPPPLDHGLEEELVARLMGSVVHVRGLDCSTAQLGSGFAVGDGLVATGAHVVSGISAPVVVVDEMEHVGQVVGFDPVADLALVRVADSADFPQSLELGSSVDGTIGALLVHDGNRAVAIPVGIATRIRATGKDIYGKLADGRDAIVLAASLKVGYSGAAVVDREGLVVGVAFSRSRGGSPVAYAVQASELSELMAKTENNPQPAGPCRD